MATAAQEHGATARSCGFASEGEGPGEVRGTAGARDNPQVTLLRVAILHYHLQTGGVSTVMRHTVRALRESGERIDVGVVSGGAPLPEGPEWGCPVRVVPLLGYRRKGWEGSSSALAVQLEEAARELFGGVLPDLWHLHNPTLGKNVDLPDAVAELAARGHQFLLQIHDFAEDGRSEAYGVLRRSRHPYPQGESLHYAVINGRDQALLVKAGIDPSRVHALPNPVPLEGATAQAGRESRRGPRLLLYPTRGIRRKNIGEAVLLAALAGGKAWVATTRAPENPRWQVYHREWEKYVRDRPALKVALGVVGRCCPRDLGVSGEEADSFEAWQGAASALMTTSVAEGFGLAFLESAALPLPLLGRDLPEITMDFKTAGLTFPGLYRALRVPQSWVDETQVREEIRATLVCVYEAYGRALPADAIDRAWLAMADPQGRLDFARLSEKWQRCVIDRVVAGAGDEVLVEDEGGDGSSDGAWSWMEGRLRAMESADGEATNVLQGRYSLEAYEEKLLAVYQTVRRSEALTPSEDGQSVRESLLDAFLSPEGFSFLKT